jgi:hypothetical protein
MANGDSDKGLDILLSMEPEPAAAPKPALTGASTYGQTFYNPMM